jgi:hypothetical protein
MALSNADNPLAEPTEPAPAETPTKKKAKAEPEPAKLLKASTSGSADVHNLLAHREIAASNADAEHLARVDAELAALGFEV